jgi:hypothetical protein
MSVKPLLIETTSNGGTIHTYPLTGGKKTFERYLGCYSGTCQFFNDIEKAKEFIENQVKS